MDPDGAFGGVHGDTLSLWWKAVRRAVRYWVVVEKCPPEEQACHPVADLFVNSTSWELTSEEKFGACTFYHLKVSVASSYSFQDEKKVVNNLFTGCGARRVRPSSFERN